MRYFTNRSPQYLPSCSPPLLPAPASCEFHFNDRAGWCSCACRQFGVMNCHSRDQAKAKWLEVHRGQESV